MSFEAALLMKSFAAPLAVSFVVAWILTRCVRSETISSVAKRLLVSHAWWILAIIFLAIDMRSLQFEEKWQRAVYWLWLPVFASGIESARVKPIAQKVLGTLAIAILLGASLPVGDGWDDMEGTKYVGWLVGGFAWSMNAVLISEDRSRLLSRGSMVWMMFVFQVSLAICALSCYGSLGAWALSLTALAVCFTTLFVSEAQGNTIARSVLWPILAAGTLVALSAVLYGANPRAVLIALFMPSFVGMADRLCQSFGFNPTWRSWLTWIVSTALLTIVVVLVGMD